MKRDKLDIEQLFRENFENAAIQPNQNNWSKIESKLNKLPNSLMRMKWLLTFATLAVTFFTYFLWFYNPVNNNVTNSGNVSEKLNENRLVKNAQSEKPLENNLVLKKTGKDEEISPSEEKIPIKEELKNVSPVQNKEDSTKINVSNLALEDLKEHKEMSSELKFTSNLKEGCAPLRVEFVNQSINLKQYEWNTGLGEIVKENNLSCVYYKAGVYIVSLSALNSKNLLVSKFDTIIVHESPEADCYIVSAAPYNIGKSVEFNSFTKSDEKVNWFFGDGVASSVINPVHTYKKEGVYKVFFRVENIFGCFDSVFVKNINVIESKEYSILFPSAFVPNKFGEPDPTYSLNTRNNQLFFPIYKGVVDYHLKIYNRRGVLIFETTDLSQAWTGYYNSKIVAQDVYVWKVTGQYSNGEYFSKAGNVTVLY